MIDSLNGVSGDIAFAGGHYAIQLLRHRGRAWSVGLTAEQLHLSSRVIGEIEIIEGRPIAQLSREKIDEYTILISDTLLELSRKEFNVDKSRGLKALEELRSMKIA